MLIGTIVGIIIPEAPEPLTDDSASTEDDIQAQEG